MALFDGVLIEIVMGAIVGDAATAIWVQRGEHSNGDDMQDLEGSKITVPDNADEKIFLIDVVKPQKRYVRVHVARATQNATVQHAGYLHYQHSGKTPITQPAIVAGSKLLFSPEEGTI